jgi:hypothetical protein
VPEHQPAEREPETTAPAVATRAAEPAALPRTGRFDAATALRLQRAIGNAALGRVLARDPVPELDPNPYDQMIADEARLGQRVGDTMLETLGGHDAILFMSRLRALDETSRHALQTNAAFWTELRRRMSPLAYWAIQVRVAYGPRSPDEVNALSAAIHGRDTAGVRTLLMGYESLRSVPGLSDVISSQFGAREAAELRGLLAEAHTRAESGSHRYDEAHYESGVMTRMVGTRNYELVRTANAVRIVVRIRLSEDPANTRREITDAGVARWERSIAELWNGKFRLRSGGTSLDLVFVPVFVFYDQHAHHNVSVSASGRSDESHWHADDPGQTAAHEFGHMLGNPDEYHLPGATSEIPATMPLDASERQRSSWEGLTGERRPTTTQGYDVHALMGNHYRGTGVLLRYTEDIVRTFNAQLLRPGEAAWTAEAAR